MNAATNSCAQCCSSCSTRPDAAPLRRPISTGSPARESVPVEVSMVPAAGATDAGLVAEITALVNRVYAVSEEGLWLDGTTRTAEPEMAELIHAEQIAAARWDGRLVGAVRVQRLDSGEGKFGMLVAAPEHRGIGVGRELVASLNVGSGSTVSAAFSSRFSSPAPGRIRSRSSSGTGTPASATGSCGPATSTRPTPRWCRSLRRRAISRSSTRIFTRPSCPTPALAEVDSASTSPKGVVPEFGCGSAGYAAPTRWAVRGDSIRTGSSHGLDRPHS